ncbi:MAG TPA: metallophosphoesterase, partial [Planctomycetota bacterium]|nr:metallophosphoesterase [Planctomycetota bacterium]
MRRAAAVLLAALPQGAVPSAKPMSDARAPVRLAVIGDYGVPLASAHDVAEVVKVWSPDLVATVGDNNYPEGAADTIDDNIGQHYHDFIAPYLGAYGAGASENRFFPALGNHDWIAPGAAPYLAYFTLPGNERYYDVRRGPVHLFVVDSDPAEPDGVLASSVQATWLHDALAASTAPFKLVTMHHPPFNSGKEHGSTFWTQWPYREWGASAVLAGHEHVYERIVTGGLPYFVNGVGGQMLYEFLEPVSGSQARFNSDFGAMLVEATATAATFTFVTRTGIVMDVYTLPASGLPFHETTLVGAGSTWKYLDGGAIAGATWMQPGFDDSSWASGPAQLGYGD